MHGAKYDNFLFLVLLNFINLLKIFKLKMDYVEIYNMGGEKCQN